jgi:hypothetical protein
MMSRRVAFLDPSLDYALRDRATRAAGMAFEKHFGRIDPRPRRPEESYAQTRAGLTRLLASAPIVPPIRVAIVHDPLSDAPGSGGGSARELVESAPDRIWVELRPPGPARSPDPPPWPECERLAPERNDLVAYRLPAGVTGPAILARLAAPDRGRLYVLGEPRTAIERPDRRWPDDFGWIVALARSARWVLTSHAAWPDWVPWCVYTQEDPRSLPGLNAPDLAWVDSPRAPGAPRLPGSDWPALADVLNGPVLSRAERIDLSGTGIVSVDALAARPALRALSVADCPYVHRDELAGIAALEELDLRGVPVRDFEFLRALSRLRTLRVDLRPRAGWTALAAVRTLDRLDLDGMLDLDIRELAECLPARALTIRLADAQPMWSVAALAAARRLEALALDLPQADLTSLSSLRGLRFLTISGARTSSPDELDALAGVTALTGLDIDLVGSLRLLPSLPNLRRLAAGIESLDGFERLPMLERLALRYHGGGEPDLQVLAAQVGLVSLAWRDFDRLPIEILQRLPALAGLGVSGTRVDMIDIARLPALRVFESSEPSVDLAPLRGNSTLESLVLHGAAGTDSLNAPEALLTMPVLRRVVTAAPALPEAVAAALEARGVTVATHPIGWGFAIDAP